MNTVRLDFGDSPTHNTITLGDLRIAFSYKTPIAFWYKGQYRVRVNDWSATTGKHLSSIDGGSKEAKAARIPGEQFEKELRDILAPFNA